MLITPIREIEENLLEELDSRGGGASAAEMYTMLADSFRLKIYDESQEASDDRIRWEHEVNTAAQNLITAGAIDRRQNDYWRITPDGRSRLGAKHFRFASDILARLGEELIPNPEQGIIELVKNAYDADAIVCVVEIVEDKNGPGWITVSDDGDGMDKRAISQGWLVIGRSKKAIHEPTPLGRLPVGDKGLGRLAALRQGNYVRLVTRPRNRPGIEYSVIIDWSDFDKASTVEDVTLNIGEQRTSKTQGTDIFIRDLNGKLGRRDIQRLARELLLLADPFGGHTGFQPRLTAPGFEDLERLVHNAYFQDATFHLRAKVNEEGIAEAELLDWKGNVLQHANHGQLVKRNKRTLPPERYQAPAAEFDLWVFLLNSQTFSTRKSSIEEVRKWLSVVGGVHLYHRGLRVRPYGDPGYDWLEMNLARARSPEERPSTNTSIGKITVNDLNDMLIQKTDRIGFVETHGFLELKRFAVDALDWMAGVRLKEAEEKRQNQKVITDRGVTVAKTQIADTVAQLVPMESRPAVQKAIREYDSAREREVASLREDLQLYRTLATTGITVAVFAHESLKPLSRLTRIANLIEGKVRQLLVSKSSAQFDIPIGLLRDAIEAARTYGALPMQMLARNRRRTEVVAVNDVIQETKKLFDPFFSDAEISIRFTPADTQLRVLGSVALLEAILTNFLTNSLNAFTKVEGAPIRDRQVVIITELAGKKALIRVLDNALGINDIDLEEIWLPGMSTTPDGTGFGLTIVRDSVADLRGKVQAIAHGELGGAEFVVELPLVEG